jgi:hypothetical protein
MSPLQIALLRTEDALGSQGTASDRRSWEGKDLGEATEEEADAILQQLRMSGGAPAGRKQSPDGRDYQAEIAAAAAELDALWDEAESYYETPITSEALREYLKEQLMDVSRRVGELYFKIPVSDYEARPIPDGQELSSAVFALQAKIEEWYAAISSASLWGLHARLAALEAA